MDHLPASVYDNSCQLPKTLFEALKISGEGAV